MLDDYKLEQLVAPLQEWFVNNARTLPWRENPTAYYVWVSEIMLQQTRVEAVKPYFDRFVRELPDVKALAECPEDKLLKLWEGLGYYNRVRNLKVAANQIMEKYHGVIPAEYDELLKLKGIGHYTAGAIASIAYGKAVPAVDGNVLRVISRVTADDSDIMKQSVRNHIEERLFKLMNAVQDGAYEAADEKLDNTQRVIPAVFNQALMELGATVCVPNGEPHCKNCPWYELCEARKQNRISELPVKSKAKARRIEKRTVFIIKDGEQVALHKRPSEGLLAGLYELPNVEGHLTEAQIIETVKGQGYEPIRIQPLCDAKHIFSHVEWHMKGYVVFIASRELINTAPTIMTSIAGTSRATESVSDTVQSDKVAQNDRAVQYGKMAQADWLFVDVEETKRNYAIPSAFSQYARYLNLVLGKDAIENKEE